jgi:hypothetical protein
MHDLKPPQFSYFPPSSRSSLTDHQIPTHNAFLHEVAIRSGYTKWLLSHAEKKTKKNLKQKKKVPLRKCLALSTGIDPLNGGYGDKGRKSKKSCKS